MAANHKNIRITGAVIAEQLGITPATVSRALAGNPRISAAMRQKVSDAARDLGYISNATARTLVKGHSNIVGILSGGLHVERTALELIALDAELRKHGFLPFILYTRSETECIIESARRLIEQGVDGLLIIGCDAGTLREQQFQALTQLLPTVFVDSPMAGHKVNMVLNDYLPAYKEAGKLLAARNCRRIHAVLKWNFEPHFSDLHDSRYDGIVALLEAAGCGKNLHHQPAAGPSVLHDITDVNRKYVAMINRVLDNDPECDAIICNDDDLAISALGSLQKRGRSVPNDIAVLGFSNTQLCEFVEPRLSSIGPQPLLLAEKTIGRLLELIDNPDSEPHNIYVPGKLINRQTL